MQMRIISFLFLLLVLLVTSQVQAQEWSVINPQDLIPEEKDGLYFRPYTGFNDAGTTLNLDYRWYAGVLSQRIGDRDYDLQFQYLSSFGSGIQQAYSGNAKVLLPWNDNFIIFGGWTSLRSGLEAPNNARGEAWQISPRYEFLMKPIIKGVEHFLDLGLDIKMDNNNLDQRGVLVIPEPIQLFQLSVLYDASFSDPLGDDSANLQLIYSPGGVSEANTSARLTTLHQGSVAKYFYGIVSAQKNINLPLDFYTVNRFQYQFASTTLPDSEEFDLGGWDTIPGYDEKIAGGDSGFFLQNEFHFPTFSVMKLFNPNVKDSMDLYLFIDFGKTYLKETAFAVASSGALASTGFELRYNLLKNISFRYSYGFQFVALPPQNRYDRGHIGLVVSY